MDSIWLVLAFPLLGSLLCATHYKNLGKTATGALGSLAILAAFVAAAQQWYLVQERGAFQSKLANWLVIPGVSGLDVAAQVDNLSVIMLCTVTGVAFLIHCYSMGYMSEEDDYGRFFASLNLFVATMVCLVMANNMGFLLVGWGGVGYASYSLIGFYRSKPSAVSAARKAFLMNVVGDVGLMLALCLIVSRTGSADFATFLQPEKLKLLGPDVFIAGALLLVGAYAKSAQLPFHTWLPDAMEGPTPVSALIHAATMVTAGVYLVVRCAPLFNTGMAASDLMPIVAIFGAMTALLAALCAVVQNDLKRILAYSTMSQLGYMFMAAGVGAYGAAIFHLVTHAFFKALLFLTAGVVIHAMHGEQDIRRMGGLGKKMFGTQLAFLIGSLALAGVPPLAGFFSKEAILMSTFDAPNPDHAMLWGVGIATALLTAYYTGRAYVLTFWAPQQGETDLHHPGSSMTWPLAVLSLATVTAGFGGHDLMADIQVIPGAAHEGVALQAVAIAVGLVGLAVAWAAHRKGAATLVPPGLETLLRACETIDGLYKALAAQIRNLADAFSAKIDPVFSQLAPDLVRRSMLGTSTVLCQLQGGSLRLYVVAVLASTGLLALFVFGLVAFSSQGGPQ
ncbi:NADH-quinone oxidoreductase subunit L [bacterium]|nr:NADH-quinone oxidoreductase subunit L [bacterium]